MDQHVKPMHIRIIVVLFVRFQIKDVGALKFLILLLCYRYERFIVALEEATKDTLPFLKEKALKVSVGCRLQGVANMKGSFIRMVFSRVNLFLHCTTIIVAVVLFFKEYF